MSNKQQLLKDFVSQQIQNSKQQTKPIVNSDGFKNGEPPAGSNWRIPGDTLYNPTPYPIQAVSDNGITKTLNPFDESTVEFPGAKYVDEYQMKFGGLPKYQGDTGPSQVIEDTTPRPTLNIQAEGPGFWERLKRSNYNPYNWGLPDYSELKSPREALYKAAYYGEPEFMWRGRRQDTNDAWWSIPEEDRLANVGKESWTDKPFFIDGDSNLYTEIADNSGNYTKHPKVPIENVKQYQKAYTDALNYTKEWVNSPMYKKMLKESTSGDSPEYLNNIESGRRNNLEQARPSANITNDTHTINNTDVPAAGWSSDRGITIVNNLNDVPLSDYERRMRNQDHFLISTDFYNEGTDKFVKKTPETEAAEIFKMNEKQKKETRDWLQTLFAHEFSHHTDRKNNSKERLIPQKDINYILNNQLDYKDAKNFLGNASFFSKSVDDPKQWNSFYRDYVGKPTEVRARLQEIRQYARNNGIYDPFTQEIDDKALEKLIKNNANVPGLDDLINIYKPGQIKYMLNHISENKTDNQGVMSNDMQFGKKGGLTKYQGDTGPSEVTEQIKEGDVSPVLEVKGERPGLWTRFKQSYFSPQNWGRDDLSDNYPEGHPMSNYMNVLLDQRSKGNTSFMWKNKKHSTEMPWLTRKEQLEQTGITDAQLYARSPFEEMVHENIDPFSYEDKGLRAILGFLGIKEQRREDRDNAPENIQNKPFMGARTDAFNLSMGKPQRRDTFSLSEYRPSKAGESGWDHNINNMDYFAINKLKDPKIQKELIDVYFNRLDSIDNLSKKYSLTPELINKLKENKLEISLDSTPSKEILESYLNDYGVKPSGNFDKDLATYNELAQLNGYLQNYDPKTKNVIYTDSKAGVMGNFTLGQGVDENGKKYVSYYDKWDIETPAGMIPFGKPYHIYDRMYYQDAGLVATSPYERIPKSWKEKYDWTPNVEEEYIRFKNDPNAPDNLRFTDDLNDYNVRGMWDSLERPVSWEQALTLYKDLNGEEWVPEEDGYYHAWSQHPGTGEWLKPKHHSTAWMNFAGYPMDPYSKVVVNPEGFFGDETLQTEYKKDGGLTKYQSKGQVKEELKKSIQSQEAANQFENPSYGNTNIGGPTVTNSQGQTLQFNPKTRQYEVVQVAVAPRNFSGKSNRSTKALTFSDLSEKQKQEYVTNQGLIYDPQLKGTVSIEALKSQDPERLAQLYMQEFVDQQNKGSLQKKLGKIDLSNPATRNAALEYAKFKMTGEQPGTSFDQMMNGNKPSFYRPNDASQVFGAVGALPAIGLGALGVTAIPGAVSAIGSSMNAPLTIGSYSLPGATMLNTVGALGAGYGLTKTPDTARSIANAYNNPTLENIGQASLETGLNLLDFAGTGVYPALGRGLKSGVQYAKGVDYSKMLPSNMSDVAKKELVSRMLARQMNKTNLPTPKYLQTLAPRIDPIGRSSVNVANDILKTYGKETYDNAIDDLYRTYGEAYDAPMIEFKSSRPASFIRGVGAESNWDEGMLLKERFCEPGSECAKTSNAVTNAVFTDITGKPFDALGNAHNAWHLEDQMTRHGGRNVTNQVLQNNEFKIGDRILMGNGVDQSTYAPGYYADPEVRHAGFFAGYIPTENGIVPMVLESGANDPLFLNPVAHTITGPGSLRQVVRPNQFLGDSFAKALVDKNIRYAFRDKPSVATYSSENETVQSLLNQGEQYREQIKRTHDLTNDEFDEMLNSLIGIGAQETKLNAQLPSSFLPSAKVKLQNALVDAGLTAPIKQTINAAKRIGNAVTSKASSLPEYPGTSYIEMESAKLAEAEGIPFSQALQKVKSQYQPKPRFIQSTVEPSKGMFRQKFQTESARTSGANKNITQDELANGLAQMAENYQKIKKLYPEASQRDLINLTTLMWNSPGKAQNKELVDFYLFGKGNPDVSKFKFDYLDKVNKRRDELINIRPQSVEPVYREFLRKGYPEIQYQEGGSVLKSFIMSQLQTNR